MLKRAFSRINKVAGASFIRQRALPLALLNTQQASHFSSFPRYTNKLHSLQSFSKRAFGSQPQHTKLTMPALSPTMEQGNIIKWHVKVGSKVEPGDQLCDVETDKATMAFENQDSGYIAAILVEEGSKGVQVGKPVAILVEEEADIKAFANYKGEEGGKSEEKAEKAEKTEKKEKSEKQQGEKKEAKQEKSEGKTQKKPAAAKPKASAKQLPAHSKVTMPALSPTMESGKITQWQKKEGEKIEAGDVIANVETDKATIDFVYQDDGYLAKILVKEGKDSVKVGQMVAIVVDEEADIKAFQDYAGEESEGGQAEEAEGQEEGEAEEAETETKPKKQEGTAKKASGERVTASPYAKKTAEGQNVDLSQVEGSGPGGRVLKHNVDEYVQKGGAKAKAEKETGAKEEKEAKETKKEAPKEAKAAQPKAEPQAQNPYTDIPLTTVREVIAKRLLQSKTTIPHYYLETEIVMDEAMKIRNTLNESAKSKISFNDMFVKAAAHACVAVPEVNSQWHGDKIRKFKNADISVAVDTGSGLITPIVFSANTKGLNEISATTKDLIEKAKKNALKPQEFQGGTFSISNLGMMGISSFAAVINPPQSAILAISKTDKKVVFVDGAPKTVNVMNVTLSCDHRVIDGAVGAKWLEAFKSYIEKPLTLLL